ncbi:MAG: hypothetical protein LQ350_008006, partial [Teloschistes chrysophthalmus]
MPDDLFQDKHLQFHVPLGDGEPGARIKLLSEIINMDGPVTREFVKYVAEMMTVYSSRGFCVVEGKVFVEGNMDYPTIHGAARATNNVDGSDGKHWDMTNDGYVMKDRHKATEKISGSKHQPGVMGQAGQTFSPEARQALHRSTTRHFLSNSLASLNAVTARKYIDGICDYDNGTVRVVDPPFDQQWPSLTKQQSYKDGVPLQPFSIESQHLKFLPSKYFPQTRPSKNMRFSISTLLLPLLFPLTPLAELDPSFTSLSPQDATTYASINQLNSLFGFALDFKKFSFLSFVYAPDAQLGGGASEPTVGLPAIIDFYTTVFQNASLRTQHTSDTVYAFDIEKRTAKSVSYATAVYFGPEVYERGGGNFTNSSVVYREVFHNSYVKRKEGWRISEQNLTIL